MKALIVLCRRIPGANVPKALTREGQGFGGHSWGKLLLFGRAGLSARLIEAFALGIKSLNYLSLFSPPLGAGETHQHGAHHSPSF